MRAGGAGLDNCGAPYSFRLVAICANFPPDAGSRGYRRIGLGPTYTATTATKSSRSNEALRIARDEG